MTINEMKDELESYYEGAGFEGFYERELKGKTDKQIIEMHNDMTKVSVVLKSGIEPF